MEYHHKYCAMCGKQVEEELSALNTDCFSCPNWNGTGCMLTCCSMTQVSMYIDGKLTELGWHD